LVLRLRSSPVPPSSIVPKMLQKFLSGI